MIDINKILQTDVLDIVFDGRNKAYGAYELRTNYKRRLAIAVISMILTCALLILLYSFSFGSDKKAAKQLVVVDTELEQLKKEEPEPPVVEPPKPKPVQIEMKQYTPPIIVNEDVKPDDAPPEMEELEDTKIGTINREGEKDDGVVAPPNTDDGKGVVELPKKEEEDWDKTFLSVQIESEYPGGMGAWKRFLEKTLRYPQDAIDKAISGPVMVQFTVDKEGNVSDVVAISGPEELRQEAVRVIKKSGKWTPAIQQGRQVKSHKRQSIIFEMGDE